MIPSTATYQTRQVSLARRPTATVLIKDYAKLQGLINDDDTSNIIGSSAKIALATKITPSRDMTIDTMHLFMRSDDAPNDDITIEVQTASAGKPSGNAVGSATGKIVKFTDQSIGWQEAHFKNLFDLSSGIDYYLVASVAGSTYSYYWGEDEDYTDGEWWSDTGSDGWDASASDKTFIAKMKETKVAISGLITGLSASGTSGTIESSAQSWTPDEWAGRLVEISSAGVSGDSNNVGMSFYISSSTVSSLEVDLNPEVRGIAVLDTFYVENTDNFVDMVGELVDFTTNDIRDRTINIGMSNFFSSKNIFSENQPRNSNLKDGNDILCKIGFSGAEQLQQFRGTIFDNNIVDERAFIKLQDRMGQFQRVPFNLANISGLSYEAVIKQMCQRLDAPFITDMSLETIASSISIADGTEAISVMNQIRQSLGWRLYGDNYGRVRFREKLTAGAEVFELGDDDFILHKGFRFSKIVKDTINILGATNNESDLSFDDETLIADQVGSAAASALSISFVSAGAYSNIRWEDTVDDGSVVIKENGSDRNTGKTSSGSGSLSFDIFSISGTPSYRIKAYGAKVTLGVNDFYVEKTDGEGQSDIGTNVTKLIAKNRFFPSQTAAESTLDSNLISKGKTRGQPIVDCRGIGNLQVEDTINVDHQAVDISNLYLIKGITQRFRAGKFISKLLIEDTLVRSGDIRYDIGLNYDTGLRYDGG